MTMSTYQKCEITT